ncbi:helix-turn-helix domain-containing protein [Halovenus sp. HT40]|jgi:predicted DNA binding protein|uniref:helix-turn-helix domain-containing protein n=1 Tax=Halovenus sp. HT40 TaxID=3126691 RepID=UPI00300EB67F
MWEVSYRITPEQEYFDRGETVLWDAGIYLESIRSMEFVEDGSVVMVYEVDGDAETLQGCLDAAPEKIIDYSITEDSDPLVAQLWLYPDETLEQLLDVHRSFGVSVEFPIDYVSQNPATIEIVETGPRNELRDRIEQTREVADVHINHVHRHRPGSEQLFRELTDRQQEVLQAAVEQGYYQIPREATHQKIADELGCSKSVVGQHLRRVEAALVSSVVPEGDEDL